jgi:hypothetical protein
MSVWYLELDDEITDAVARLRAAKDDRVVFVVPAGSRIGTGRINFRLLAREAVARDLKIALVSGDAQVRALAASAGLPVYASVGDSERGAANEGPLRLDITEPPEDGTDPTATVTTAPGPGAGVRTAGSRPVRRPRSRRRKAAMAGGVLALIAVVGGGTVLTLYRSVPTASIRLALAPRALGPVALAITVSTSRPTDPEAGNVQGQLATAVVRDEAVVTATHELNLSNRARGTVVFTNTSQAPVPIPELTAVATPEGIRFLTQDAIQAIPPGATASVEVRAEQQGDAGNVGAGTITVIVEPAIAAQLGEGGGVTNPDPTKDGQTEATTVFGQDDYDRAVEELAAKLEARLAGAVPDVPEGVVAFPGTAQRIGDVEVGQPASAIVGVQGKQTTIAGSLAANVLTASEAQIQDVAQRMVAAAAAPDEVVPGAVITLGEPTVENGEARYGATGDALVYGLRVTEDALREQVRSKTIAEAQRILGEYGTATITLSPDWLPALPDDPNRIEIETGPPPAGATPAPMTSPQPSTGPTTSPAPSGASPASSIAPGVPASVAPAVSGAPGPSTAPVASA